ncbi:MAG: outer membrane protein assembly factor BamD, partial [Pseudomonadota bacterium]|nr:outer membrane protein assembly factor BamD [Pseudomonadota bacterium]
MIGIRAGAKWIGAVVLMAALSGCGGDGGAAEKAGALDGYTPKQIFERGEFELERRRSKDAAFYFSEIERLYPYSEWAKQALIMQAFSYHRATEYENSRAA